MSDHEHEHPHDGHDHQHLQPATGSADASVRSARPSDAPAVGVVQSQVWRLAYRGVVPDETLARFEPLAFSRAWRAALEGTPPAGHQLLVGCAGPQVVGYVSVGPCADPDASEGDAEVLTLGVHPDARRQGHGSRLLNAAVDVLRERGADTVYIWLPASDEATRKFLSDSGFGPDSAYRDSVVGPSGETVREIRMVGRIS